ncbi:MAG: 4Fe-4S ferredoxin iron-sulfur binding domain protein [Myxococcales bacterium]|nr:4Fe-4S ferredoxin iron-sulfur binding domain protein [Myxococcales bacterium]
MTWVVPLALGGLAVLLMAVFTMLSARKRHHAMVAPAQTVGPRILVHDINDDRCTGCDACVAVCPTNVLDLVANKSRVLRFEDCIQCEACMFACPTEALVMFPEGSTPPPLKIPEIDENFQTAVPGQYLIGEVAGKPLVKNAANLGRAVIEHMLQTGLRGGTLGRGETTVDVAIIGSGPGGLSAALTCIQKGLTYVVLEKEQMIASTIARYPKGKLVMAEPYDTLNLSLLPVFDSAKEQLIPIWRELLDRVGVKVRQGESVEKVERGGDGAFDIRTTVGAYRSQRVVMSIGTRGKPRTLQVPGENMPKIFSLLEDPDEWRGRSVLVVGGGDSACEAALALSDAGAKVMISYRGKGFNRAAPKNKQTIEAYAAEGRIKAKLGSQVLGFDDETVTLALADGSQKRYPNDAAFVLIGADPPVQWLEKMGIRFVERPHQHQMGKSDDIVRRLVARAAECPEDAARAAAQVLGGSTGIAPAAAAPSASLPMPMGEAAVSGPRKWLRSATSIFSNKSHTNPGIQQPITNEAARSNAQAGGQGSGQRSKKFDAPVPLSEFAKRGKPGTAPPPNDGSSSRFPTNHTGHGRRDQLSAGERTRILRMLRDEGGRLADEDSQVYIGAAPGRQAYDFDFDEEGIAPAPAPAPSSRQDIPAKPAVVVGLAQAQAGKNSRSKRATAAPPPPPSAAQPSQAPRRAATVPPPVPGQQAQPPQRPRTESRPPPRRAVPAPFSDEPTRQVDDELLSALRATEHLQHRQKAPTHLPTKAVPPPPPSKAPPPSQVQFDEPTRMANIDAHLKEARFDPDARTEYDGGNNMDRFLAHAPATDPNLAPETLEENDEATRMSSIEGVAAMERVRKHPIPQDERTRAVNIRNDKSISDIDWDLD